MRVDREFVARVLEALSPFAEVTGRAMFGGYGLFEGGAIFGLIDGATLYLKTDDASRPAYLEAGSQPFNPYDDERTTLRYYALPLDVLEDPSRLESWLAEAVRVGRATRHARR